MIHTWCGIGPYFDFIIVTINSKNVHFYQLNELCKVCSLQPTLPTLLWKVCFVRLLMLGSHDVTLTTTKCIRCKRDAAVEQPLTRAAHQQRVISGQAISGWLLLRNMKAAGLCNNHSLSLISVTNQSQPSCGNTFWISIWLLRRKKNL